MGTCYYVICRDCKVSRDLDKFYSMLQMVHNRCEALALASDMKGDSFRSALLASFLYEHRGHNCTICSEYEDATDGCTEERRDLWGVDESVERIRGEE